MVAAPAPTTPPGLATVQRGPRRWARSLRSMLRFDLTALREALPIFLVIQILMGAGMAVIYGFYFEQIPPRTALFIATGAPTLALIPVGFALIPTLVAQQRLEGTYDFVWSLPVPRMVAVVSSFILFTALTIPGTIVALAVAAWRYGLDLDVSPIAVVAVLLTSLMATSVGFGMAHAVSDPRMMNLIVNLVIFLVILFSPIAFPIAQFPGWLAAVHRVLPFYHMAVVIRDGLTDGLVSGVGTSYVALLVWTVIAWAVTAWVVGRRG